MKNLFVALCLATSALAVPVAHEASEVDDAWSYFNDRFAWGHLKREADPGHMPTNMNLPAEHVPATEEVHQDATPHADVPMGRGPTNREASKVDDAWSYFNDRFAWGHLKREADLGHMPTNMNLPAEHVPATEEVHKPR